MPDTCAMPELDFLHKARTFIQQQLPEIERQVGDYVPRVLVREGTRREEIPELRSWRRLGLLAPENRLMDDREITSFHRIVLIGDSGSGKSYVLRRAYSEAAHAFLSMPDAPLPCLLDLERHLSSGSTIKESLDHRTRGLFSRLASDHKAGCKLFVDGLDDRLRLQQKPMDFANALSDFLMDHSGVLRNVVLACRRAYWNQNWPLASEHPWGVYHTDHLDIEDYAAILPDPAKRQEFFTHAHELGIMDLLSFPFTGFDLARRYGCGEELPTSRRVWFQQRIETSLRGTDSDRVRAGAPPLQTLNDLSRQLACLATFGGVTAWTVQEAVDLLGESEVLKSERKSCTCDHLTKVDNFILAFLGILILAVTQVRILFDRPLFSKTDEHFSFCHQLFREYLAAVTISSLPLRKQRQLLESAWPRLRHRILTPHRGVAVFLAEMSRDLCDYLVEKDPVIAFLAELPCLPRDVGEKLTKSVIDGAIASHRAYWWEIPPRGERLGDFLQRHCPRSTASFLRPYLQEDDEMSLLWGTACAVAWGGSCELNGLLLELAHNDGLHVEVRINAIDAVLASNETGSIRALYDLLDCKDDQVRGHALHAYRMTERPSPRDYISKLHGGANNDSLYCSLQREATSFSSVLDSERLRETFQEVSSHLAELGNLSPHVLRGLLQRALELGFTDISPGLITELLQSHESGDVCYRDVLRHLLANNAKLLARVWTHIMDLMGRDDHDLLALSHRDLAQVCNDTIFDLLPPDESGLNWSQTWLIEDVLQLHFQKQPTPERLETFRQRAPAFTRHLQLPQQATEPAAPEAFDTETKIIACLNQDTPARMKCLQILRIISVALHGKAGTRPELEETIRFLRNLAAPLQGNVLEVFERCVLEIEYSRERSNGDRFAVTRPEYAIPFWVLWHLHYKFSVEKLDEFIRCYAFLPLGTVPEPDSSYSLLDDLRKLDVSRWGDTVVWLVESPEIDAYKPINYLIERDSDLYVERCRQRLVRCDFGLADFATLLDYWAVRKPPDFRNVLQVCYECLVSDDHRTQILFAIIADDCDWAWNELSRRIEEGTAPALADFLSPHRPLRLPHNPARLRHLGDWYAHVKREEPRKNWPDHLAPVLLETIVRIGGEDAIDELTRLRDEKAFPGAQWLSHEILRIEDDIAAMPGAMMRPGQLLDFVNREALGVVLNERDLFEWVCQAIEQEKEDLEKQGKQVAGYWNEQGGKWSPKTEPQCQNLLWPAVQRRLTNLSVVGVEEKVIRSGKADFWVEKPIAAHQSLQVAVELKVARKGYGYRHLVAPIEAQLWQQYLEPSACRHGVYVVLWFKDSKRYPYPTRWATPQELAAELDGRRQDIAHRHDVELACYVIDMTTRPRRH